jgi:hypothetical protein
MITIEVPGVLDLESALAFCSGLGKLDRSSCYEFDFADLGHVEPFTMAYCAAEIKRFRDSRPHCRFRARNYQTKTYQGHMGFFKAFGLQAGKEPGEACGGNNYLPITVLNTADVRAEAAASCFGSGDVVERMAAEMARMLARKREGNIVDTITYSMREVIRNIIEHSGSDTMTYCAQYWPSRKLVEVAILDAGTGVKASLSCNPHLGIADERDAVHLALLPGISGKMFKGVRKRKGDPWQNSGYGLYMTSRICRSGGSFCILSNNAGLVLNADEKVDLQPNYKGTALRLEINTDGVGQFAETIECFRKDAKRIGRMWAGADLVEPSVASLLLSRDFQ